MVETIAGLWNLLKHISIINVIDILIVSYIVYKIFMLVRETRAETLLKGLVLILIVMKVSEIAGLITLNWIISEALRAGLIALVIIFQPELRRALEHLGRSRVFTKSRIVTDEEVDNIVTQIVEASANLSDTQTGALIVIEQETGLNDYIETGVKIDAILTSQLLENIFVVNTPLHDGAVIIKNDRVAAAACFLPLTEDRNLDKELGTRHRAAIGVSENSDAIVIVVSEETGTISLAINGKLTRGYNGDKLKDILIRIIKHKMSKKITGWEWVKTWTRQKLKR
jgi:TIGR00159 family protein